MKTRERPGPKTRGATQTLTTRVTDEDTERLRPSVDLTGAVALIGRARGQRLLVSDFATARRLNRLAELVNAEAEVLEGIEHQGLELPDRRGPKGAALGWFLRHDAHTRPLRRAHGLPLPDVEEVAV